MEIVDIKHGGQNLLQVARHGLAAHRAGNESEAKAALAFLQQIADKSRAVTKRVASDDPHCRWGN